MKSQGLLELRLIIDVDDDIEIYDAAFDAAKIQKDKENIDLVINDVFEKDEGSLSKCL